MADSNVDITAGSGTSIDTRTEGTNGHHRQVVVLGDPATNAGVAPVDATNGLATDVKALPGTVESDITAIKTSVETLDNAISGSEMQVDIVSGTVTANLGATDNAVLDSIDTKATDIPNVIGTDGAAGPSKTVSVAGTESGGNLQELRVDSDGHLQVDVLSTTGGDATAANQSTIIGHVDGIEGLLTTIDADTGSIATDASTLAGAVSGTEMQVDVVTSALPTGAATETTLDAVKTAVETIDNAISGSEMQVDVVGALPAGTNVVGDVGLSGARTSGGTTLYKNIDVDESEDQVKGTAGQVYWIHAINLSSTTKFLKFYNATAASVTVGTTTPDLTFPIPTTGDTNGAGFTLAIPNGIAFGAAITIAATTGVADADSGAPGANEVIVNLGYA